MNRKVDISFFCRKPLKNYHFSAENFYSELFKKKLEGFNINKKIYLSTARVFSEGFIIVFGLALIKRR